MVRRRQKPRLLYATLTGDYVSIDKLVRVTAVEPLEGLQLRLTFDNGEQRVRDLEPYLHGPIFESIRENPDLFRAVRVDDDATTIVWPNGADLCPDLLYYNLKSASMAGSDPLELF